LAVHKRTDDTTVVGFMRFGFKYIRLKDRYEFQ